MDIHQVGFTQEPLKDLPWLHSPQWTLKGEKAAWISQSTPVLHLYTSSHHKSLFFKDGYYM